MHSVDRRVLYQENIVKREHLKYANYVYQLASMDCSDMHTYYRISLPTNYYSLNATPTLSLLYLR